jgi:MFS family permease
MRRADSLYRYEFVVLCLASTFGFCNIAIFYSLSAHLERLGIDASWRGMIIAAEPAMAVILRPLISPLLTRTNALNIARLALLGNGVSLACYQFAQGAPELMAVRILHGISFVCLVSAITALLVLFIPKDRSAQAFGVFSLTSLAPFAVMPLATEYLLRIVGDEAKVYALASVLIVPALVLLAPLGAKLKGAFPEAAAKPAKPKDALANLLAPRPAALLAVNLCLFSASTMVFFYAKGYALALGAADPGFFFTLVFAATILMRLAGSAVFDRLPLLPTLAGLLAGWCACLVLMGMAGSAAGLFVLAAAYGLILGAIHPLLNSAMFRASPGEFRGYNLNMMLFMMDVGYVIGPLLGGTLLARGLGHPALFLSGAGIAALAAILLATLTFTKR